MFYRERGALPYDPFAYGFAIALVEVPYLILQVFRWNAVHVCWLLFVLSSNLPTCNVWARVHMGCHTHSLPACHTSHTRSHFCHTIS